MHLPICLSVLLLRLLTRSAISMQRAPLCVLMSAPACFALRPKFFKKSAPTFCSQMRLLRRLLVRKSLLWVARMPMCMSLGVARGPLHRIPVFLHRSPMQLVLVHKLKEVLSGFLGALVLLLLPLHLLLPFALLLCRHLLTPQRLLLSLSLFRLQFLLFLSLL